MRDPVFTIALLAPGGGRLFRAQQRRQLTALVRRAELVQEQAGAASRAPWRREGE